MSNARSARSEAVMPTACEHSFRRPAAAGMSPTLPNASGFARRISDDHIAVGSSETQSPDVRSARLSLESFGSPADHMSKTDISLLLSLLCALDLFLGALAALVIVAFVAGVVFEQKRHAGGEDSTR